MSLYITSSVNKYALIDFNVNTKEAWEIFDQHQNIFNEVAKEFGLNITRESAKDYKTAIVIHNKEKISTNCIYGDSSFNYDLSINDDNEFEDKSNLLIERLRSLDEFVHFKDIGFNEAEKRHFVTS